MKTSITVISSHETGNYFFSTDHCQEHGLGNSYVPCTYNVPMMVEPRKSVPDGIVKNFEDIKSVFYFDMTEIENPQKKYIPSYQKKTLPCSAHENESPESKPFNAYVRLLSYPNANRLIKFVNGSTLAGFANITVNGVALKITQSDSDLIIDFLEKMNVPYEFSLEHPLETLNRIKNSLKV